VTVYKDGSQNPTEDNCGTPVLKLLYKVQTFTDVLEGEIMLKTGKTFELDEDVYIVLILFKIIFFFI